MNITWLGHSCFAVESGGYRVVLDPYYVESYPPLHTSANEVLCSHHHRDHDFVEAVELTPRKDSPFTVQTVETFHDDKGGTLRLGAYPCIIQPGTTMERCYGTLEISERHRHRYEFNNDYREALTSAGLVLSGLSPDGRLVETVELTDQPFFVGVQYHPEFKSRPNHAHPLFKGFVQAALERENT